MNDMIFFFHVGSPVRCTKLHLSFSVDYSSSHHRVQVFFLPFIAVGFFSSNSRVPCFTLVTTLSRGRFPKAQTVYSPFVERLVLSDSISREAALKIRRLTSGSLYQAYFAPLLSNYLHHQPNHAVPKSVQYCQKISANLSHLQRSTHFTLVELATTEARRI